MDTLQLTFLRFIAAAVVVIFHFGREVPSLTWGNAFWLRANPDVSFFFLLSGFILAHVYGSRGVRNPRKFYVARLARIVPLYWGALLVVIAYTIYKQTFDSTAGALNVLMLQAWVPGYELTLNSPGWSISAEVFFYLIFPWLLKAVQKIHRPSVLVATMLAVWGLNQIIHIALLSHPAAGSNAAWHQFEAYNPLAHVATFIVGMIGGLLFDIHRQALSRMTLPLIGASLVGLSVLFLLPNSLVGFHHNGLATPFFLMLLWGLGAAPDSAWVRLLCAKPLLLLGEASYAIYILQMPVWYLHYPIARKLGLGLEAAFWSYFLLLVAISVTSFKLFEAPLREWIKANFSSPRTPRRVSSV